MRSVQTSREASTCVENRRLQRITELGLDPREAKPTELMQATWS